MSLDLYQPTDIARVLRALDLVREPPLPARPPLPAPAQAAYQAGFQACLDAVALAFGIAVVFTGPPGAPVHRSPALASATISVTHGRHCDYGSTRDARDP